jgi:hypothetical protein
MAEAEKQLKPALGLLLGKESLGGPPQQKNWSPQPFTDLSGGETPVGGKILPK